MYQQFIISGAVTDASVNRCVTFHHIIVYLLACFDFFPSTFYKKYSYYCPLISFIAFHRMHVFLTFFILLVYLHVHLQAHILHVSDQIFSYVTLIHCACDTRTDHWRPVHVHVHAVVPLANHADNDVATRSGDTKCIQFHIEHPNRSVSCWLWWRKKTSISLKTDEIQQQNATSGLANGCIITRTCGVNLMLIFHIYLHPGYFSFVEMWRVSVLVSLCVW